MGEKETIKIEVIRGVAGDCLSINNYRFVGVKPWGGGRVIQSWTVTKDDFINSLGHIEIIGR